MKDTLTNRKIIVAIGIFISVSTVFFNYVMNHIYVQGSGMADVGWFMDLMAFTAEIPPKNPSAMSIDTTFFSTHISLVFYITSAIYYLSETFINEKVLFSLFVGSMYGLVSISVLITLKEKIEHNKTSLFTASLISVLAAFNGAGLGLIGFPHIEIAIPALLLLFITLHTSNYKKLSIITFVILLTIREDSGLHAFLILSAIIIANFIQSKKVIKDILAFAIAGLIYSLLAIYIQKTYFPGDNALARIYTGTPPYAHITLDFIIKQISTFFSYRAYIWAPWLVALYLYIRTRDLLYLAGIAATTPWLILSLTAYGGMAQMLSNYYAFPMILSILWPIFSSALSMKLAGRSASKHEIKVAFASPVLSMVFFLSNTGLVDGSPWRSFNFEYLNTTIESEKAAREICKSKEKFGNVLFDEPTSALMISCIEYGEWSYLNKYKRDAIDSAHTLIFSSSEKTVNGTSIHTMRKIAIEAQLGDFYKIPNTQFIIATKKPVDLAKLFQAKPIELTTQLPDFSFVSSSYRWDGCKLPTIIGHTDDKCHLTAREPEAGFLNYGPYIALPEGRYQFKMAYSNNTPPSAHIANWDIITTVQSHPTILKTGKISGTDGTQESLTITFTVPEQLNGQAFEIRSSLVGKGITQLSYLELERLE